MDAIQLYTLREMDASVNELLERVADAGFGGVEFAYRVQDADPKSVRETLDKRDLAVPSAHVPMNDLETDLETTAKQYHQIGCERLVVPYLDDKHFADRSAVRETAERLDDLAKTVGDEGFPLLYHNHDAEFVSVGDESAFDVLLAETEHIDFELDVGLATAAGADPVALLERDADRIELLHCTDADLKAPPGKHVSFGVGGVDYEAVFETADAAGIDWYVYENGSTDSPRKELDHVRRTFCTQ